VAIAAPAELLHSSWPTKMKRKEATQERGKSSVTTVALMSFHVARRISRGIDSVSASSN
jgi:hypothetical protein